MILFIINLLIIVLLILVIINLNKSQSEYEYFRNNSIEIDRFYNQLNP